MVVCFARPHQAIEAFDLQDKSHSVSNATPKVGTQPGGERAAVERIIGNQKSLVVRLYARMRFLILRQTFLQEIGQYLPRRGRVLDLGCGFGLFSLYFALDAPERQLTGVDLDVNRIDAARECATKLGVTNVDYTAQDALAWKSSGRFDAVFMLDLIHHLPKDEVEPFLTRVTELLVPGGTLLLKDVSNRPFYKMLFTLLLDRLMVGLEPIHYWDPAELCVLVERLGYSVKRHTINDLLPYPHILYVCTRTGAEGGS